MSSSSDVPPKGKTDSDAAPSSSRIGPSAVDEDWFDVDVVLPEDEGPAKVAKRDDRVRTKSSAPVKNADKLQGAAATSAISKSATDQPQTTAPAGGVVDKAQPTGSTKSTASPTGTTAEATVSQSNTTSNHAVRKTFGNPFLKTYVKASSAMGERSLVKPSEVKQQSASSKPQHDASSASHASLASHKPAPNESLSANPAPDEADSSRSAVEAQTDPTSREDNSRSTTSADASSGANAKSKSVLNANSKLKYAMLAAAAALLGGTVIVTLAMPKRSVRTLPPKAAQPGRVATPSAVATLVNDVQASSNVAPSVNDVPPISTVVATNSPTAAEASAESSVVAASDSAATAAPPGSAASPAASADGFAEAFHRNAAKKDAKWAEVKPPANMATTGAQSAMPASGAAPPSRQPVAADPLDVLKRLEDARKSKRQ